MMPVKDLVGRPRRTAEDRELIADMHKRFGPFLRKRPGKPDEDGLLPATPPSGPKPMPLAGAAEVE